MLLFFIKTKVSHLKPRGFASGLSGRLKNTLLLTFMVSTEVKMCTHIFLLCLHDRDLQFHWSCKHQQITPLGHEPNIIWSWQVCRCVLDIPLFLTLLRALNSMQSPTEDSCSQNKSVLACYPCDYERFCSRTYFSIALYFKDWPGTEMNVCLGLFHLENKSSHTKQVKWRT